MSLSAGRTSPPNPSWDTAFTNNGRRGGNPTTNTTVHGSHWRREREAQLNYKIRVRLSVGASSPSYGLANDYIIHVCSKYHAYVPQYSLFTVWVQTTLKGKQTNKIKQLALARALTLGKPSVQGLWHHLVVKKKRIANTVTWFFWRVTRSLVSVFLAPAVTSTKPMATADAVDACKYKCLSLALENTTAISSESS